MVSMQFLILPALLVVFTEAYIPGRVATKPSSFQWNERMKLSKSFSQLPSARGYTHPLKMSDTAISFKPNTSKLWNAYLKVTDTMTVLFPVWTVLFACISLKAPETFAWFTTKYFTASLGVLMLSMGITLTIEDFQRVTRQPLAVIIE